MSSCRAPISKKCSWTGDQLETFTNDDCSEGGHQLDQVTSKHAPVQMTGAPGMAPFSSGILVRSPRLQSRVKYQRRGNNNRLLHCSVRCLCHSHPWQSGIMFCCVLTYSAGPQTRIYTSWHQAFGSTSCTRALTAGASFI